MGNEGLWWVLAGALMLLAVAALGFAVVMIVLLFVREWRKSRRG